LLNYGQSLDILVVRAQFAAGRSARMASDLIQSNYVSVQSLKISAARKSTRAIGPKIFWLILVLVVSLGAFDVYAQDSFLQQTGNTDRMSSLRQLRTAGIRLPVAAILGAALAFRQRRRGTPPRSTPVIQTQIILSIIGALVMLVVGLSVARAFGVVGVAGLIRYRAKIDDPKDASVMLATLAVGLASGVGLYLMAVFSTAFVLGVLWLVESIEPHPQKRFTLKIESKAAEKFQPQIEQLLRRSRAKFELRSASAEVIAYEVQLPIETHTDALSKAIFQLDETSSVEWDEHKK
jgi:hypothetical protein